MAADELLRHEPGAGGHVEHAVAWIGTHPPDQRAAPARVLAEAQQRPHPVVIAAEAGEEVQCMGLPEGGARAGHPGRVARSRRPRREAAATGQPGFVAVTIQTEPRPTMEPSGCCQVA